jgi:hypothetical protein
MQIKLKVQSFALAFIFSFITIGIPAFAATDSLQLNQTTVTLKVGQRLNIMAYNGTGLTVSSNSAAVKATMFGSYYISLTGVKAGSAKVTVCSKDLGCATASVVVGGGTANNNPAPVTPAVNRPITTPSVPNRPSTPVVVKKSKVLLLSQTNVRVPSLGTYNILAESSKVLTAMSDSSVVRTAVNNNQITFYGVSKGSATVKICDVGGYCASVHVVVTPGADGAFSISQTVVAMETGKTLWISTTNGSGITVLSNSSVVKATVKDNLIYLTAASYAGRATLKVCSNNAGCILVYVTVKQGANIKTAYGSFKSITLDIGQSVDIPFPSVLAISYYLVGSLMNPSVASLRVNTNNFTVMGKSAGATTFKLCPLSPDATCGTVGVTVRDVNYCGSVAGNLQLSDMSVIIKLMQTVDITASTCKNLVAISDSGVVRTAVNGSRVTLYATKEGETTVKICDASLVCVPVSVIVVPK